MIDESQIRSQSEAIVRDGLQVLKENIIANHFNAGQRASGRTAESMTVTVETSPDGVSGVLTGRGYFGNLETGNRAWSKPRFRPRKDGSLYPFAPIWFVEIIEQWAMDKGVSLDSPFGVATSIMMNGTKLFREGGRSDIYSNEIPAAVESIANRLAGLFDVQLMESILRTQ